MNESSPGVCARCHRPSYSLGNFGWCPWCDREAPAPTPRQLRQAQLLKDGE